MSFGSLGLYTRIRRRCKRCHWRLYEASNHVRFCMYCDWFESDNARIRRLNRDAA